DVLGFLLGGQREAQSDQDEDRFSHVSSRLYRDARAVRPGVVQLEHLYDKTDRLQPFGRTIVVAVGLLIQPGLNVEALERGQGWRNTQRAVLHQAHRIDVDNQRRGGPLLLLGEGAGAAQNL